MAQIIPSENWPRRVNPLTGGEDFLKQNPSSDSVPQEERVPGDLISDFVISNISLSNVGSGVGVFDNKIGGLLQFRSINNLNNKTSISVFNRTVLLDVNSLNVAAEISITDLDGVSSPSGANQYLKWNGTSYVFDSITAYSLNVLDGVNQNTNLSNGANFKINGVAPIKTLLSGLNQINVSFEGKVSDLVDTDLPTNIPDGYVLSYDLTNTVWVAVPPITPSTYSFNITSDDSTISTILDTETVTILGDGLTISTVTSGTNEITVGWTANLGDLANVSSISPSNNQILTYNSTNSAWEPKNPPSTTIPVDNGLSYFVTEIQLGGSLIKDTVISGDSYAYAMRFPTLKDFYVETNKNDQNISLNINDVEGIFKILGDDNSTARNTEIKITSHNNTIEILSKQISTNEIFGFKSSNATASIFYELNSVIKNGFFADENKIRVLDGVNTPSTGHVLTWMSDGSSQFQPISGAGFGDDWGNQVVQHDLTLTGDGTVGNTLKVAVPLPSDGQEGEVLTIVAGDPTWTTNAGGREFVAICEVERESEVSILEGKLFLVVPNEMNGWTLKSYAAAVYTLGATGTTDIELQKNGSTISNSDLELSTQYATRSNVNNVVNTGDRINVNITGVKTTKDKGLTLTLLFEQ